MKFAIFCHSLVSDWNHGNAHFLRGITRDLLRRGHMVEVHEPEDGWSRRKLLELVGPAAEVWFRDAFPELSSRTYPTSPWDPAEVLEDTDVVLVHEWTDPRVIEAIGRVRRSRPSLRALFHDTHHRAASAPEEIEGLDLSAYDGVLAFGRVVRDLYLENRWIKRAWVWHEAADTTVFYPRGGDGPADDLVWVGNWGDHERTAELHDFLLGPAAALSLTGHVHGVRYPEEARRAVAASGLHYEGWLPNYMVPEVFARHRVTVHVPRRPYTRLLPGVPTIRMFEALACGIPLVCSSWEDAEELFRPGTDYLVARDGDEMTIHLKELLNDESRAAAQTAAGLETIHERHTCGHRVDELLQIVEEL